MVGFFGLPDYDTLKCRKCTWITNPTPNFSASQTWPSNILFFLPMDTKLLVNMNVSSSFVIYNWVCLRNGAYRTMGVSMFPASEHQILNHGMWFHILRHNKKKDPQQLPAQIPVFSTFALKFGSANGSKTPKKTLLHILSLYLPDSVISCGECCDFLLNSMEHKLHGEKYTGSM